MFAILRLFLKYINSTPKFFVRKQNDETENNGMTDNFIGLLIR